MLVTGPTTAVSADFVLHPRVYEAVIMPNPIRRKSINIEEPRHSIP
jgi:hypothetical protein